MKPSKNILRPVTSICSIHGPYKDYVGAPIGCPYCAQAADEDCPFESKEKEPA